ncbi:MAG: diaminopimelate decarboxylase [Actinobacteria bacterium]|nr:diaminopimelate decarboxylase [Actinomycetota bacterium]MCL5883110.1 diaminopimelate decarboxylase [Actinomycetota bacterium]
MSFSIPPLPRSSRINSSGNLEVAGCDVVELTKEFGTPLFIYDEEQIRESCRKYRQAFSARIEDFDIVYASKAFSCIALCQLIGQEGLSLDVASGGELHTALKAWFPPENIYLHGNANSLEELERAVRNEVGRVVIDSLDELTALDRIAGEQGRRQRVLLRITPGIEAHTHDFIQTGKLDSKFGFCLADGVAEEAVATAMAAGNLEPEGLHSHIGSQIFSLEPFARAIAVMADFAARCAEQYGFECRLLDVGGGLGVAYTGEDEPASADALAETIVNSVHAEFGRVGLPVPRLAVEPGRSIVANAGLTAYTIEAVKTIPGIKTYVAVSGGMSDNLRPMLYGAQYEALIASRPQAEPTITAAVAGKHCESGDIIIREAGLADPQPGEILVTPGTGAYGYSMASNYNGQPRPAVIFVKDQQARVIIRRESYEDLVRLHERLE